MAFEAIEIKQSKKQTFKPVFKKNKNDWRYFKWGGIDRPNY